MSKQKLFSAAAMAGLMMSVGCASQKTNAGDANDAAKKAAATPAAITGECHGINACKGKGECGGPGYGCAGNNACKGKGWLKTTKEECDAKKGKFKAES